ncbi:MAG: hypothetical protein EMLJLAPB_00219 [Candidatus Argoarchaeum ethanivorans]|uniref:DUF1616 domain-containing protein n=1 Tax=Candidatus Argoarchaeum ethanivorans TaxID=2608793 RepID=A0A811T785_9EURY|nr:MAG: hypothetical protein EMLJLAPB_00219 [Candidatus Argoarchaeum ethanivorans]
MKGVKSLQWIRSNEALFFDLILVIIFTFLAYLFVLIPPFNQTPLRVIFSLLILLFLPGYLLISAMFPRKKELSSIERFTLSIGLSIAIFVFDGFIISITVWRFRPAPIIYSLSLILLILMLITLVVRLRVPKKERFSLDPSVISDFFTSLRKSKEEPSDIEKALVIALVGSIIIASGMLAYAKLTFEDEEFTALYILGEDGKAEDYPSALYILEPSSMIVGIENYEHARVDYTLKVRLGGRLLKEQKTTLSHEEKWVDKVYFTPKHPGKHMKLEFLLYRDDSTIPHRSVHLWVDSIIDYNNLTMIRRYAILDTPKIGNPDMEMECSWEFVKSAGYFRGYYTKFHQQVENATIYGYVSDNKTGKMIENAHVAVKNRYGYKEHNTTDASGYYEIGAIADHFWIESSANGYEKSGAEFDIKGGERLVVNLTNDPKFFFNMTLEELSVVNETLETTVPTELAEKMSTIRGYVTDNVTWLPIEGARVKIRDAYGFERHAIADEDGYFRLKTLFGRSSIEVRYDGYTTNTTTLEVTGDYIIKVRLDPVVSLVEGHIYDNTTDAPISSAYIQVEGNEYSDHTRSNEAGYYEMNTVAGPIIIKVSKTGYFEWEESINIPYGEVQTLDLRLDSLPPIDPMLPLSTISGYVHYNEIRLAGVKVTVTDNEEYEKSTLTDSNGYFEMEVIPGHLMLFAMSSAYMESSIEFDAESGERMSIGGIRLDALPESTYQIKYPSETLIRKGYYGGIYQDVQSEEGIAVISFKVRDSYTSNRSKGCMFKQVLINNLVVWEDDVEDDEEWQAVKVPITLDNGTNQLMLRVYAKQDSRGFPLSVWWDDVKIKHVNELSEADDRSTRNDVGAEI